MQKYTISIKAVSPSYGNVKVLLLGMSIYFEVYQRCGMRTMRCIYE